MTLRCLIIDDEPLAHEVILSYSADLPFLQIVGQCFRATDAFAFLSQHEVDLIFLDIRMPKLNGIDFLKTLAQKPQVIITSAFEEYALESFDLAVCDYLLKPFRFDRFLKAANRALENELKNKSTDAHLETKNSASEPQLVVKSDKKHIVVNILDLQYLESMGNYVKLWNDNSFLLTHKTLSSFEEQFASYEFVKVHKSYLINKKFIHYLEGNQIFLKNGQAIPVGKNYKATIKQLLDLED
jgi:DNA-binding LytR/AlgR family response regulator